MKKEEEEEVMSKKKNTEIAPFKQIAYQPYIRYIYTLTRYNLPN